MPAVMATWWPNCATGVITEARVALASPGSTKGLESLAAVVDEDRFRRPAKPGEQQVDRRQAAPQHGFLVNTGMMML